ncbi:hypothetical protein [Acinetobacter courvalinii]|uniref:hypothetical protein n=1 Tax=Acinetobacter courvalinii TaxID=280147 RepID=UPI0023EF047B|nr:hypothetical protein [Acinetobacter courvalinii]
MAIKLSNKVLFSLILILTFLKIIAFILLKNNFINISFGAGSDADYYHAYAMGDLDVAVNIWPVILRFINDLGFYSRDGISFVLFLLNILIIPILTTKLSGLKFNNPQMLFLYCFLLCVIYPTLFFYTFDVYRDIFMVTIFLLSCLMVKKFIDSSNFLFKFLLLFWVFSFGFLLFKLRAYLGYAFFGAFLLYKINFTKRRILYFFVLYIFSLFLANYLGFLDSLTEYRSGFDENLGGSTLGLDFSNPIMFIPNFILSSLGQLFGLYITNSTAAIIFILETLPFIGMLIYIVKNIRYTNGFSRFLIIFFVLYASVWLIGNDNLGTAVRLRIYNYFSIYICFFYILKAKEAAQSFQELNK